MISGCEGPQILERSVEKVLPQVEETRPERGTIGRRVDSCRRAQSLERAHEHGQLEVRAGDPGRAGVYAGAVQHGLPLDELGVAGGAVPRASLGDVGLELEQVAPERIVKASEGRLDAIGGSPQGSLGPAPRRRLCVTAGPAPEP